MTQNINFIVLDEVSAFCSVGNVISVVCSVFVFLNIILSPVSAKWAYTVVLKWEQGIIISFKSFLKWAGFKNIELKYL